MDLAATGHKHLIPACVPPGDGGRDLIITKKKNWLRNKISALRTSHHDTLSAVHARLNEIIAEPIYAACAILDQPNNTITINNIAGAGKVLEECNNQLFELLYSIYPNERGTDHVVPPVSLNSSMFSQMAGSNLNPNQQHQDHSIDYIQLDASNACFPGSAQYRSDNRNSSNGDLGTKAIQNTSNMYDSESEHLDVSMNLHSEILNHSTPKRKSSTVLSQIPVTLNGPTNLNNNSELCKLNMDSLQNPAETDRSNCVVASKSCQGTFRGTVSDVVSPDRFSIHPEENIPVIKQLELDLNAFYADPANYSLQFSKVPPLNQICAVIYQVDNKWYRAAVVKVIDEDVIEIEYIDYGNMDKIHWRTAAMRMHPRFCQLPQQAMTCFLADVQPLGYGSSSFSRSRKNRWDDVTIEWFDKSVYGNNFEVMLLDKKDQNRPLKVQLYHTEETKSKEPVMWSVGDLMTDLRLAEPADESANLQNQLSLTRKAPSLADKDTKHGAVETVQECYPASKTNESSPVKDVTPSEHSSHETVVSPTCTSSSSYKDITRSIPAGMEKTHRRLRFPKKSDLQTVLSQELPTIQEDFKEKIDKQPADDIIDSSSNKDVDQLLTPTSSITPDTILESEEKKMTTWDPMSREFKSLHNSYNIDTDNACMALEGADPEEVKVCRHYMKGKCWNGDKCPNFHPKTSYTGEAFSASSLEDLDLRPGSWCIVHVTTVISTDYFYVHVIKRMESMEKCVIQAHSDEELPALSPQLSEMVADMHQYYTETTRKLKDMLKPALGEVYVVHVPQEKDFYRGMILEVIYSNVKVHLVDFGKEVLIPERYLHPMCSSFRHLPKQSLLCSLHQCESPDYEKIQKFANLVNKPHLAMQVHERRVAIDDGPLPVSLYVMSKEGLQYIDMA